MKNYMVLIHMRRVFEYYPLSSKNFKSKERSEKIQELAEAYGCTLDEVVLAIAYYLATIIKVRVKESIQKQRIGRQSMSQLYKPLSPEYKKRKVFANRNKFYINTGELLKSLRVWKYQKKVFVGIKSNEGELIALWNEKGTKTNPARPLFTPHVRMVSKNIDTYVDKFIELVNQKKIIIKPFKFKLFDHQI